MPSGGSRRQRGHPAAVVRDRAAPDGGGRVALGFETEEQARENADARAALATGEAVGQGGTFEKRFSLESSSATGTVVTLALEPTPRSRLLSDIAAGPVLFATC